MKQQANERAVCSHLQYPFWYGSTASWKKEEPTNTEKGLEKYWSNSLNVDRLDMWFLFC